MKIERPKSKQPIPGNAKRVFKGVLFDVYQWEQELFDGTKKVFEKVKRPDTAVVFPVLPDGSILLTEEEQPGVEPVWGAFGGRIEENENPLSAAKRELLEESGYTADEFVLWQSQNPIQKVDWAVYVFIARGLKKIRDVNPDSGERFRSKTLRLDELIDSVVNNYSTFYEPELVPEFFGAKISPKKREELRKLFRP